MSATVGGPIRRDRVHIFANYEYERQPLTFYYTTPYPEFNVSLPGTTMESQGGVRSIFSFPPAHMTVRWARYHNNTPCEPNRCGGSNVMASSAIEGTRDSNDLNVALSHVLGTRAVTKSRAVTQDSTGGSVRSFSGTPHPLRVWALKGGPSISLRGFTQGRPTSTRPQHVSQGPYQFVMT